MSLAAAMSSSDCSLQVTALQLGATRELKVKTVPDMLSVLWTAAFEDVAPLLGGVELALYGDPKLIRR